MTRFYIWHNFLFVHKHVKAHYLATFLGSFRLVKFVSCRFDESSCISFVHIRTVCFIEFWQQNVNIVIQNRQEMLKERFKILTSFNFFKTNWPDGNFKKTLIFSPWNFSRFRPARIWLKSCSLASGEGPETKIRITFRLRSTWNNNKWV
jgi:hypothetical protein